MSAPHIILDNLPSLCQKLSDLVEVWYSYNKNNFACFFETWCSVIQLQICQCYSWPCWVLSYMNSLYLHLRWWHQKPHLLGSSWIGRRQVQALGSREDVQPTITVLGQTVAVVEEFVYLIHSTTQSSPDISRCNAITRAAIQNPDKQIWSQEYPL